MLTSMYYRDTKLCQLYAYVRLSKGVVGICSLLSCRSTLYSTSSLPIHCCPEQLILIMKTLALLLQRLNPLLQLFNSVICSGTKLFNDFEHPPQPSHHDQATRLFHDSVEDHIYHEPGDDDRGVEDVEA